MNEMYAKIVPLENPFKYKLDDIIFDVQIIYYWFK